MKILLSILKGFFTAPVFEGDTEKTRTAKLLYQITLASLSLPAVALRELGYAVGQEKFVRLYTRQNGK